MTDEVYCSVFLALLQVAFLGKCDDQEQGPRGWPFSRLLDLIADGELLLIAWERRKICTLHNIWLILLIRRAITPSEHGYLALPVCASSLCQSRVKMGHNNDKFL